MTQIVIGLINWRVGRIEVDQSNPWTVEKLAIECNGVAVGVTFGGGRGATVAGVPHLLSDPVPAAAFGLSAIPRETTIAVRLAASVTAGSGELFPSNTGNGTISMANLSTTETGGFADYHVYRHAPAAAIDQVDAVGPLATPAGASPNSLGIPVLLLGRFAAGSGAQAVYALGDSITGGTGDGYGPATPSIAGSGYVLRAALDGDGGRAVATFNAGRLSYRLDRWREDTPLPAGGTANGYRLHLMRYADIVTDALSINDISATPKRTTAELQALLQALWGTSARRPRERGCCA